MTKTQANEVFKRLHQLASPEIAIKVRPEKRSKYGNIRTQVDGRTFDSQGEAGRYLELMRLERAGHISELRCQVAFELAPPVLLRGRRTRPLRYVADFVYVQDGRRVVEDFKGKPTEAYVIKRHLMMSVHGIEIHESRKRSRA